MMVRVVQSECEKKGETNLIKRNTTSVFNMISLTSVTDVNMSLLTLVFQKPILI